MIQQYNINGLLDLWTFLMTSLFPKIDGPIISISKKLEDNLKKYFLVCALEHKQFDSIHRFFGANEQLSRDPSWARWFGLYISFSSGFLIQLSVHFDRMNDGMEWD